MTNKGVAGLGMKIMHCGQTEDSLESNSDKGDFKQLSLNDFFKGLKIAGKKISFVTQLAPDIRKKRYTNLKS